MTFLLALAIIVALILGIGLIVWAAAAIIAAVSEYEGQPMSREEQAVYDRWRASWEARARERKSMG